MAALRGGVGSLHKHPTGLTYHFVGIGGCGMSGLAQVLVQHGHSVTGSDLNSSVVVERLAAAGIAVGIGHGAHNLPEELDCLVVSAAVKPDNPELIWAQEHNIKVYKYAQLLGQLSCQMPTIAVAGTHGKSTSSAWLAYVLRAAGLDPSFVIGADVAQLGGGSGAGQGEHLVVEACEYDRSFHHLRPAAAAILNIEGDHFDYYRDIEEITDSFAHFVDCVAPGGLVVVNADDERLNIMSRKGRPCDNWQWFSIESPGRRVRWRAENLNFVQGRGEFDLVHDGTAWGRVELTLAGRHNVSNALAVAALAHWAGVDQQSIIAHLSDFQGVKRRMTCKGEVGGVVVLDDYAHHPTEIRVTLEAIKARYRPRKLWCVFQPHQHSRTRFLLDEFALSFDAADVVLLPDIYFVRDSEALRREINAAQLADRISTKGPQAHYLGEFEQITEFLMQNAKDGDLVVTMGAGDVWKIGDEFIRRFGRDSKV
ncbi:MAG: UDP-N-acetylmuramate--L-alanine ligase [Sedimentisphaerales bacterium]|nr:UDP-N-acetylmuramate--L-alanine ligase [Sedimentisphaerales bacterium]